MAGEELHVMPRKLVQDGYRGWYGFESRYDTAIRNSLSKLWNQNARLGLVKGSHKKRIKELEEQEKAFEIKQDREKKDTQKELVEMRAYRHVYRQYSFTAYSRSEEKRMEREKQLKEDKKKETTKLKESLDKIENIVVSEKKNMPLDKIGGNNKGSRKKSTLTNKGTMKGQIVKSMIVEKNSENKCCSKDILRASTDNVTLLESMPPELGPVAQDTYPDCKGLTSNPKVPEIRISAETEEATFEQSEDTVNTTKTTSEDIINTTKTASEDTINTTKTVSEDTVNTTKTASEDTINATKTASEDTINTTKTASEDTINTTKTVSEDTVNTTKTRRLPSSSYGTLSQLFMTEPIPEEDEDNLSDLGSDLSSDLSSESSLSLPRSEDSSNTPANTLDVEDFGEYHLQEKRQSVAVSNAWKLGLFRSYTLHSDRKNSFGSTSSSSKGIQKATDTRPKLWEIPLTRSDRYSKVFPQHCRNAFRLKRMIDEKAGRLMEDWAPENVRRMKARRILDKMSLPDIVQRQKPTSAIFRDFKRDKEINPSRSQYQHVIRRPAHIPKVHSM